MPPRAFSKLILCASILSLAGVWLLAFGLWPSLPERLPMHFNAQGLPDRIAPRCIWSWFPLPILSTGMTAFMLGIGAAVLSLSVRRPDMVNIPSKEKFLALGPEARTRVLEPLRAMLFGMPLVVNLIFCYVLLGIYAVATETMRVLPLWPVALLIASQLIFTIGSIYAIQRAIRQETLDGQ